MIRSLFFDIDGTLVSFKTHCIPESTVCAIAEAHKKGIGVYISTGRPKKIITNLDPIEEYIDGYITANGALCFIDDKATGKRVEICCNPIPSHDVQTLMADATHHGYPCVVVGEKDVAVYNHGSVFDRVFVEGLKVGNIDLTTNASDIVVNQRILQFSPFIDTDHEHDLMQRMSGCVSGRWHPEFTDITSQKADKGKGLIAMARHIGLDISETMAFGDGGNDTAILRTAGIGVAMGNACDKAIQAADYITTSVDDNGIMNALTHFGVI
ncbi:Cof-type HAD-IIB family hydrolase [Xylanibacter muris]|nr:Cof-type HAD-IIB family hydrolase [Xylanibacter muris]